MIHARAVEVDCLSPPADIRAFVAIDDLRDLLLRLYGTRGRRLRPSSVTWTVLHAHGAAGQIGHLHVEAVRAGAQREREKCLLLNNPQAAEGKPLLAERLGAQAWGELREEPPVRAYVLRSRLLPFCQTIDRTRAVRS